MLVDVFLQTLSLLPKSDVTKVIVGRPKNRSKSDEQIEEEPNTKWVLSLAVRKLNENLPQR